MNCKIRKTEDNLITIGNGVMLFGVWTFLRFVLSFFIFGSRANEADSFAVRAIAVGIVWAVSLLDAGIRVYVGYAARCEGMRRKRLPYLALNGVLLTFYSLAVLMDFGFLLFATERIAYLLIVLVIDVTSMIFLLLLMINSITIRKLRKQTAGNGGQYES